MSIRICRCPADTRPLTAVEKSLRIGYISRVSPTRTMETPPFCSVLTFISVGSRPFRDRSRRTVFAAAQLTDLTRQLGAPAVDARLHGAFGQAQLICDFLVRQFLDVAH